jgi:hypothetical protein
MRSGGAWDAVDPEWTELIRAHLCIGWQAEDATAPFAIPVPSATAAPGTLCIVKFRDDAGEQRIGIVRTATHMQILPAAANQPGTSYSVLAANAITVSDIRACKIMADKLQPTTRAIEWHHRELATGLSHDHPAMSKKDVRSFTNTRWRNLTDENKKPYLQLQTDDAAFKARTFANNKRTHEQRKNAQYTFASSNPLYETHILRPLDSISTHRNNNTWVCTLETSGTPFTVTTNSDYQYIHITCTTYRTHSEPHCI